MTVSYVFKYHDTSIWDEYLNDDSGIYILVDWIRTKKVPNAVSVAHSAPHYTVEIIFKEEKDLTFFLLTL